MKRSGALSHKNSFLHHFFVQIVSLVINKDSFHQVYHRLHWQTKNAKGFPSDGTERTCHWVEQRFLLRTYHSRPSQEVLPGNLVMANPLVLIGQLQHSQCGCLAEPGERLAVPVCGTILAKSCWPFSEPLSDFHSVAGIGVSRKGRAGSAQFNTIERVVVTVQLQTTAPLILQKFVETRAINLRVTGSRNFACEMNDLLLPLVPNTCCERREKRGEKLELVKKIPGLPSRFDQQDKRGSETRNGGDGRTFALLNWENGKKSLWPTVVRVGVTKAVNVDVITILQVGERDGVVDNTLALVSWRADATFTTDSAQHFDRLLLLLHKERPESFEE